MEKLNYKKLALLGITGGILMASQVLTAADATMVGQGTMLAGGCGGGKCGGFTPAKGTSSEEVKPPLPSSETPAPQAPQAPKV